MRKALTENIIVFFFAVLFFMKKDCIKFLEA